MPSCFGLTFPTWAIPIKAFSKPSRNSIEGNLSRASETFIPFPHDKLRLQSDAEVLAEQRAEFQAHQQQQGEKAQETHKRIHGQEYIQTAWSLHQSSQSLPALNSTRIALATFHLSTHTIFQEDFDPTIAIALRANGATANRDLTGFTTRISQGHPKLFPRGENKFFIVNEPDHGMTPKEGESDTELI